MRPSESRNRVSSLLAVGAASALVIAAGGLGLGGLGSGCSDGGQTRDGGHDAAGPAPAVESVSCDKPSIPCMDMKMTTVSCTARGKNVGKAPTFVWTCVPEGCTFDIKPGAAGSCMVFEDALRCQPGGDTSEVTIKCGGKMPESCSVRLVADDQVSNSMDPNSRFSIKLMPACMPPDMGSDMPRDMGADLLPDLRPDAPSDLPADLPRDGGADLPSDAGQDAGPDAGGDLPADGGADLPLDVLRDLPTDLPLDLLNDLPLDLNGLG